MMAAEAKPKGVAEVLGALAAMIITSLVAALVIGFWLGLLWRIVLIGWGMWW